MLWLTKYPARIFVLSERSESKDLSSIPTKEFCPERPSGAEGSLLTSGQDPCFVYPGPVGAASG